MLERVIASFERNIVQFGPTEFWIGLAVVSGIAIWSFYRMYRWYHYARLVENVPTAKIRSAAQGYVELIGQTRLMDGPVIVAPLSRKMCVWYRYKIEEKISRPNSNGMSNTHWRVVKQAISEELFLLEDDTGRCVIDPDGADVIVTNKTIWHKRHVIPPRRYTEELIIEGEPLYAIGLFKTVADIESQKLREQVAQLLRQWKNDPNQLLHQFDHDRNNELSSDEWEQARKMAERQIRLEQGQREKLEQLNVLQIGPHKDQAFILSTVSEQDLIKKYKWRAFRASLIFFITGSIAIWALNIRLGM